MRSLLLILMIILTSCSKPKSSDDETQKAIDDLCASQAIGTCIDPIDDFQYGATQLVLTRNQTPVLLVPTYKATADVSFYPSVSLPTGININRDTGVISGSPDSIQEEITYAIIIRYKDDSIKEQFDARGEGGLKTFFIKIKVLDIPPSNLELSSIDISVDRRDNMSDILVSSVEGGPVLTYEVTPALPEGISLNTQTGKISGSPVQEQERTKYTLIAKNSGGQDSEDFYIEVKGRAPESLSYLDLTASYYAGEKLFRNNLPLYSGDTADSYEINPNLPSGVFFDTTTGIISGNPSEIVNNSVYTVKAINQWGETQTNIKISTLDNITGISTGLNHTCLIKNKKVNCSGRNEFNQLGRVGFDSCLDDNLDSYPCEKTFNYVMKNGNPLEALSIVSTRSSNCSLGEDSKVYCWGDNLFGQLGTNSSNNNEINPQAVKVDENGTELTGVVKIDAGNLYVCAQTSSGELYCWGDNSRGQLGNLVITSYNYAIKLNEGVIPIIGIESFSAGYEHLCYIKNEKVRCQGNNDFGTLGDGSLISRDVFSDVIDSLDNYLSNIKEVYSGRSFTLAKDSSNDILSWGDNSSGQLSTGDTLSRRKAVFTSNNSNKINTDKIFKGEDSFCFIDSGLANCVGKNNFNFGRATVTNINTNPVKVLNEAGDADMAGITKISEGYSRHRCVAKRGELYCFGKNAMGQLGDTSVSDSLLPKSIETNQ